MGITSAGADILQGTIGGTFTGNESGDSGGVISGNTAKEKHGGGIYLGGATLNLYGGSITDNAALDEGGGIRVEKTDSGKLNVHGKPVVKENSATRGNNIFLRSGKKITVDGALSADAHLDVTLDDEYGTVTKNFSAHNKDQDPAQCFSSVEGCSVSVSSGEVVLGTAIGAVDEDSFIDRSSRIATYGSVSSKNWMAGISGERRLNEINIPGTHDSAMTDVIDHPFSSAGAFFGGPAAAQTQYNFINQQLNAGYRFFDLRLNNTYQVVHNVITYKIKDDIVTLTGEEPMLDVDDIPYVGNSPDEGYEMGAWLVEPPLDEAIAEDVTYTYAYAPEGTSEASAEETEEQPTEETEEQPEDNVEEQPEVETAETIQTWMVLFYENGGSGDMEGTTVEDQGIFTLPENGYTAPEGRPLQAG